MTRLVHKVGSLIEEALFRFSLGSQCKPVFILASPRTGSTYVYQSLIDIFGLPYIANITNNYFFKTPILGFILQKIAFSRILMESNYGKTKGAFQPSEGSRCMSYWFGGREPSQIKSAEVIESKKKHFFKTLSLVEKIYSGKPILIKNAWNCYRVKSIAKIMPDARFIWLQRNILDAALSDLEARHKTKGSPNAWNSATPANIEYLKKMRPIEQVIENQYEMNMAVMRDLSELSNDRWISVWYEDLLANPADAYKKISNFLQLPTQKTLPGATRFLPQRKHHISLLDFDEARDYVDDNFFRFSRFIFRR